MSRPLLVFGNPEKKGASPSGPGLHMPGWPFRLLLAGPPGSGKRNLALNVIYMLDPPPTAIHIVHYDPDTVEYDQLEELGVPLYFYEAKDFPTFENLADPDPPAPGDTALPSAAREAGIGDGDSGSDGSLSDVESENGFGDRPLVIVDELTKDTLTPQSSSLFERLINYGSTHHNASVIVSAQSLTNLPAKARRGFNQFALWEQPDQLATNLAAQRAGVPPALLNELFGLCRGPKDFIWVDTDQPPNSRWRYRLNFTTPIALRHDTGAAERSLRRGAKNARQ